MERGEHDIMITRKCVGCDNDLLFTINETLCLTCKVLKYGDTPKTEYIDEVTNQVKEY